MNIFNITANGSAEPKEEILSNTQIYESFKNLNISLIFFDSNSTQIPVKVYSSFKFVRGLFVIYGTFPRLIRRKHEQTTNKPHRKPEFHPTLTRRYGVKNSAYTEKFFSIISTSAFSSWIKLSGAKTCNRFLVDKDKTMPRTQNK